MNEEISQHVLKTGTLTIGIVCKEGIVVAADRRQSYGAQCGGVSYIALSAKKIEEINERMIATTAGTASDSRKVLEIIRAELRLKELKTKEKVSVKETASFMSNMVFQNIRTPSMIPSISHFLLAGFDDKGVHLFDISPDGYLEETNDYSATGAGLVQAHPILDSEFKKDMSVEEGIKLVVKCVKASMNREPSVGNGIDVFVVKQGEVKQVIGQETSFNFKEQK